MTQEKWIYESPDGGDTVYQRRPGDPSGSRELHSRSQKSLDLEKSLKHSKLWGNIHRAAGSDLALREMLDRVEAYYHLKNQR